MPTTKKVVHITTVHHPLDPRIYYKQCQSLQQAGYDVTLIAPDGDQVIQNSNIQVVPIKKHKNKWLRMLLSSVQAYKQARKLSADYYQIHDPELLPVAWLLKNKHNVVIYDIHEDYETSIMQKEYIARPLRKFVAKTYRFMEKFFSKNLELILAEKYYKEKNPSGTCILNYPLLNEKVINHEVNEQPTENKLIYTGNVSVERGALIQARIPQIAEGTSVHVYGKCPKALADKMYEQAGPRKDQLHIQGIDSYVPKTEIDQAYASTKWLAGIALFPPDEHYYKKELTKFFEYMSFGLPIICSNFPVWKAFVEQHACGIAVDPTNEAEIQRAITYLKDNPAEALQMGQNGRKAVLEQLNWDKEKEKLILWYDELRKEDKVSVQEKGRDYS
ncbi:glycosyltransferase [Alkalihalobacterium chitinilyticum]|uniref:Glycosyltransferase n=1 Tax=Alkalihalobacterium chitinilyticum TaxID=2980103 RepID=A0ABT5VK34_9BACI|nr:glycosyltransferase [Alkalihalobacterium chitinilyticum]MDE5415811.1 glycosyltransferase [Alkalihalobacterium chitinilyticum]